MNMRRWFNKLQKGQAMMEYWPTIPASLMIILSAALITSWFERSILTVVDGLENPYECVVDTTEKDEGPTSATLGCHAIQLVGKSYNSETDRTTAAYKVSSRVTPDCPDISHWDLEFPQSLAANILSTSEPYEWVVDPTTGIAGIKFDTGYNSESGGGGGKGGGKKGIASNTVNLLHDLLYSDDRTILVTLGGYFQWSETTVGIKAGTEVYYSTISAPTALYSEEEDKCKSK